MSAVHDVLVRITDDLEQLNNVDLPDYMDTLDEADWDLLVALQHLRNALSILVLHVAERNRAIICDAWVEGAPTVPRPGVDAGPHDPGA